MEVINRFKGFDLVGRVLEELWIEVCNIVQEAVTKTIPKRKKFNKAKWLSEEALQIAFLFFAKKKKKRRRRRRKRREAKNKAERERYTQLFREAQGETEVPLKGTMRRNRGKQQNGKD